MLKQLVVLQIVVTLLPTVHRVSGANAQKQELSRNEFVFEVLEGQPLQVNLTEAYIRRQQEDSSAAIVFEPKQFAWGSLDRFGMLSVQPLDREDPELCHPNTNCSVTFDVLLWRDVRPADLRVVLRVRDLNDNRPRWPTATLHLAIAENAPPNSALADTFIEAIDADAGDNGIAGYRLTRCELFAPNTRRQQLLAIDECPLQLRIAANSKAPRLVAVQSLDRETVAEVRLIVRAFEGGNQPASADLQVVVMVTDLNDNTPEFQQKASSVTLNIRENFINWRHYFVADDLDDGLNGEIVYSLTSDRYCASHFELSNVTGALMLVKPLDFERQSNCSLTIRAADRGTPSHASSIRVFIRVVDVNDNEPVVQVICDEASGRQERPVTVREGAAAGTLLPCRLLVTDADTGPFGDVECSLDRASNENFDLIRQDTHIFTLATRRPLDRETQSAYQLAVTCADNATQSERLLTTALVNVELEDLNDNPPVISSVRLVPAFLLSRDDYRPVLNCTAKFSECTLRLFESNRIEGKLLSLVATDSDSGANGRLSWRLTQESERGFVSVDNVGGSATLVAVRAFDREALAALRLELEVRDGGVPALSAGVRLTVEILDLNDNPPAFARPLLPERLALVEGHYSQRLPLAAVVASDADSGANGRVSYALHEVDCSNYGTRPLEAASPLKRHHFSIDHITGQIVASGTFDRESTPHHCLNISAVDAGKPALSDSAIVKVLVLDVNDNVPRLLSNRTLHVRNTVAGSQVALLQATDADAGENGTLHFRLASSAGAGDLFAVDARSGSLMLVREALQRDEGTHRLLLNVSDAGTPSLSAVEELLVVVDRQSFAPLLSARLPLPSTLLERLGVDGLVVVISVSAFFLAMMIVLIVTLAAVCRRLSPMTPAHERRRKRRLRRLRQAGRRMLHRSNSMTASLTSLADSTNVFAMSILAANGSGVRRAPVANGRRRDDSLERGLDEALAVAHEPPSMPTCNSASVPTTPAAVPRHLSVDLHRAGPQESSLEPLAPAARRTSTESSRTPLLRVHAPPSACRSSSLSPPQPDWATCRAASYRQGASGALLVHEDVLQRLAKECRRGSEPVPSYADEWAGRRELSELSSGLAATPAPTPERQSGGRPASLVSSGRYPPGGLGANASGRSGSPLSLPPLSPECNCTRCANAGHEGGHRNVQSDAGPRTSDTPDECADTPVCALLADGKPCAACNQQSSALRVLVPRELSFDQKPECAPPSPRCFSESIHVTTDPRLPHHRMRHNLSVEGGAQHPAYGRAACGPPDASSWNLLSGSRQTLDLCPNVRTSPTDGRGSPSNLQAGGRNLDSADQSDSCAAVRRAALNEGHKSPGGRSTILAIRSNVDQTSDVSDLRANSASNKVPLGAGVVLTPPADTPDTDVCDCRQLQLSDLLRRQSSDHASVVDHLFLRSTLSSGSGVSAGSLANPAASYLPASARSKLAGHQFSTEVGQVARLKRLDDGLPTGCAPVYKEPSLIKACRVASEQRQGSNSAIFRQTSSSSAACCNVNGGLHQTATHYAAIPTRDEADHS